MNRADFFKILGLGSTGLIVPNTTWSQKPLKIYDNYIKGLPYYQFKTIRPQIKIGNSLILKREIANTYDRFAVSVYYTEFKLGYLAAYENVPIANMLEQGVEFKAFVSDVKNDEAMHDNLAIEIYAHLIVNHSPTIQTDLLNHRADDSFDSYRAGFHINQLK